MKEYHLKSNLAQLRVNPVQRIVSRGSLTSISKVLRDYSINQNIRPFL